MRGNCGIFTVAYEEIRGWAGSCGDNNLVWGDDKTGSFAHMLRTICDCMTSMCMSRLLDRMDRQLQVLTLHRGVFARCHALAWLPQLAPTIVFWLCPRCFSSIWPLPLPPTRGTSYVDRMTFAAHGKRFGAKRVLPFHIPFFDRLGARITRVKNKWDEQHLRGHSVYPCAGGERIDGHSDGLCCTFSPCKF